MTTALERLLTGYYNSDPVSVANPGGFGDDGHETNFPAALVDLAEVAETFSQSVSDDAIAAAAAALTALNSPATLATCPTNITIPALGATVNFTLGQTNKAFAKSQKVLFGSSASPANNMVLRLDAFTSATGVGSGTVIAKEGAGTFNAWDVSLTVNSGVLSLAGLQGALTAAAAKTALAIAVADLTNYAADQATRATAADGRAIAFATAL